MSHGLPRKLRYAFMVQAAVGSLVIVLAVVIGCSLALRNLVDARLRTQADEYWSILERNATHLLPATGEVQGYFVPLGQEERLPEALRGLEAGHHFLDASRRDVLVERRSGGTLVLSMSFAHARQVLWTMAVLIMLVCMATVHLVSWYTYRTTRRLVAPVSWLAEEVSRWEPDDPDHAALIRERIPGDVGREVEQLSGALRSLSSRVQAFVQRERDFTRDASHELRTPLTVIRVASDMLLADTEVPRRSHRSLQRIQRASRDMEAVIDAFLILAREDDVPPGEEFDVRELVYEEVEKVSPLLQDKPVELRVTGRASPRLRAPPRVLGVILGNLLSNACVFTESGRIEVEILADRLVVRDTGIGMAPEVLQRVYDPFYRVDPFRVGGKGMGLSIVRRLGERFGWPVALESAAGEGTTATIRFG